MFRRKSSVLILPTAIFAVLQLAGCAAPPTQHNNATLDDIEASLGEGIESNTAPAKPPQSVSSALVPPVNLNLPGESNIDVEPRFDIKVDKANARQFFMGLVEGTPYNMVVHPKVHGRISLDLKNVTVPETMEAVRDVYGYDYERIGNAYRVYPDAIRTKIYKVDYLDVKRSGKSKMTVSSGQITENLASQPNGATNSGGNRTNRRTHGEASSGSGVDTVSESQFWNELRSSLQAMVHGEGRSVVVSPQSGVIVVRAMPDELRTVEHYLSTTQQIVQRQVIIEAKIIEVTLADGYRTGINWGGLFTSGADNSLTLGHIGGGSVLDTGASGIDGNTGNVNPASPSAVDGTAISAFGGVFTAALNIGKSFNAFIELLKTQGDVHVLSSPQVSTVNNQKAVIKVGSDEFFVTDVQSNVNTGTATTNQTSDVELTPFFSGVALDVIPQISAEGYITLHIHPSVVEVTEQIKDIGLSTDTTLTVPLANSSVRESDTIIRARSGQVVIIGGLMKTKTRDDQSSVPFFGDIPLIGGLFRHTRQLTTKSELVILLKPTVVDNDVKWAQNIRQIRERYRRMAPGRQSAAQEM
jgi:MSHA biogenesis protein MshL